MLDDSVTPSLFDVKHVTKARTAHRCCECGRMIMKGEGYDRIIGKWEGDFNTHKQCDHCVAAASWLMAVCNGYPFTCVYEDLTQHWHESEDYRSGWLGRAIIGIKRKWRRLDGTLMEIPKHVTLETSLRQGGGHVARAIESSLPGGDGPTTYNHSGRRSAELPPT